MNNAQDPHKKTQTHYLLLSKPSLSVSLDSKHGWRLHFSLGPVHFSCDLQVRNSTKKKKTFKLGLTGTIHNLKIILLQRF